MFFFPFVCNQYLHFKDQRNFCWPFQETFFIILDKILNGMINVLSEYLLKLLIVEARDILLGLTEE